jgi:aspartate aminotransferase
MTRLAGRTARIAGSQTMQVTSTVDRLRREGVEVIDFGAGEPDFSTPSAVGAAGHSAIDHDLTKYTPVGGTLELKRAVCDRYVADYGVRYDPSEVIITAGGKQALFNTALSLFGPGDEVLVHMPGWPTLVEQVKLADATPVLVDLSPADAFGITARPFLDAITERTRGIIINSPCNPTGALISEAELTILAKAASARGIWIVVDLCYEKLVFDATTPHNLPAVLAAHCPGLGVICGSASKAYAMTGWRLGWAIAPEAVIAAESAIQSHATSNASSISQQAAREALSGSQAPVTAMLDEYRRRRDAIHGWLTEGLPYKAALPAGAFYLFVDVRAVLSPNGLATTNDFAQALLDESRVAVTPGEAFGAPGFVRISFATSMDVLRDGSRRMAEFARRRLLAAGRPAAPAGAVGN